MAMSEFTIISSCLECGHYVWYKQNPTQFKGKYYRIAIVVCGLPPHDNNWSINRVYVDEINNYLCCKSKLIDINFINNTKTLQDGHLKPNLFYADKLHLI